MTTAHMADGPVPLTVSVHMLSDWHIGSGAGRHGLVDRGVQRDGDGLPFVPAKTLAGVWRDACETAARALDADGAGDDVWQRWVEFLFGSQPALRESGVLKDASLTPPRPAALHVDSLHYPEALRRSLSTRPLLRTATAFLKPGVAIDPRTGRAADRLLRFEEMARGGVTLTGQAELTCPGGTLTPDQLACASALLDAGTRLVEALGGRRRRGAGRCRLDVTGLPETWRWLEDHPAPPVPETAATDAAPARTPSGRRPHAPQRDWEIADLRLVLRRPLLAYEQTMGNMVRSTGRLSGRVLLPGVLERLRSAEAQAAARAGDLVITDATVEVDGQAGRAEPLALARVKDEPERLVNLLAEQPPDGVRVEPVEPGAYVGPYRQGTSLQRAVPRFTVHAHNTVDDALQRPVEAVGGLYTYQAIAEGTVLRAQVRVPSGLLPAGWHGLLTGGWRVGHSRKDGYGRCDVTARAVAEVTPGAPARRAVGPGGRLRVWLLSDVLVMDERLRLSTRVRDLARVLGDSLGVVLREAAEDGEDGSPTRFSEVRRNDAWHARWGLPRASLLGLRAGGCLSFDVVSGTVTETAMTAVELAGVGLRRAEGFGQLSIEDPLLYAAFGATGRAAAPSAEAGTERDGGSPPPATGTPGGGTPSPEISAAFAMLEEAAWQDALHRSSQLIADTRRDDVLGAGHGQVSPSQLAGVLPLLTLVGAPGDAAARTWLERLRQVPGERRRRPWPDAVVEAVTALLCDPDRVWDLLALPEAEMVVSRDRVRELRERLWPRALRTVVEDCLTALRRAEPQARDQAGER